MDITKILSIILMLMGEYRKLRDAMQAAGQTTDETGAMLTDAELIELLRSDAQALQAKADALLAKYPAPVPEPPAEPPPTPGGGG